MSSRKALNPSVFSLQHPHLITLPYIKIILGKFKELFILGLFILGICIVPSLLKKVNIDP